MRERGKYTPYVPPVTEPQSFGSSVEATFVGSIALMVAIGKAIVLVLVAVGPWLPLVAVPAMAVGIAMRRVRRARP
jgi:hypothetical protein